MYYLRQEFLIDGKKEEIEIDEKDFVAFKNSYFKSSKKFKDVISFSEDSKQRARIFLGISFESEVDFTIKKRVIKALSPVFEIALDNAFDSEDKNYLINYRNLGFSFEVKPNMFIFSLGDSNDNNLSFSMAALVYSIVYDKDNLEKFNNKFLLINDSIIEGGFNSASFNGLQGYYFSNYFVKWLIDLRRYASKTDMIDDSEYEPIFNLIDNLENPKDHLVFTKN